MGETRETPMILFQSVQIRMENGSDRLSFFAGWLPATLYQWHLSHMRLDEPVLCGVSEGSAMLREPITPHRRTVIIPFMK